MKTYYFDSGLPRSGSTLITALLNQNPQIHAGTLSPVFEVMYYTQDRLKGEQAQAFPKPQIFKKMVRNVMDTYYEDTDAPYIVDKSRAWTAHLDLIKQYITPDPKIICTVRHPLEILASFIGPEGNIIESSKAEIASYSRLTTVKPRYEDFLKGLYSTSQSGQEFPTFDGLIPRGHLGFENKHFVLTFGSKFDLELTGGANFWKEYKDEYDTTYEV